MYIGDYLGRRAIYSPEALAVVDTGKMPELRLNYAQLNERALRLANGLRASGIEKGDRVAILAQDGVEHLDLLFACGKLGAIHTALNWRLHWRELQQILAAVTPAALIYDDAFKDSVASLAQAATSVRHWIHLDGTGIPGSRHFGDILDSASVTPCTCATLDSEAIAAIVFTGGTTGMAKGAQISHRQIAWNCLNTVIHDLGRGDIYLNVFPLFHVGGLFVYTLPQIILGGTTVLMKRFDPEQVLRLIEWERITVFAAVPAMYQMLTQTSAWAAADLSSLRFCTSGGAPLPVPLVEQYTREKGIRFKQGFGMTEFGPGLFALAPEDAIRKAGSIGRPNYFIDARIVDGNNQSLGPNQVGELVLKGPSIASGYFNNAAAWAEAIDADGWFHTGDLARYDEGWYFTIVDRLKDMFISGGENVYPAEIEAALYQHPAVFQCAVIGVPDAKWGEVGKAFVVLKPNQPAAAEELLAHLGDRLARYKIPRSVEFVASLPISAAGKVLRRELRELQRQSG
ncbi:MAG: long-chain fatty acid--CoA ligase [Candidatus Competibacter sp.]|nr:long-chain fatty acid--CoA ligase [Candidatus Competibacter sp.]MDG4606283.1 long-chain fatty acid--CoA ligase [Candidatus Contendobacter sp.]HRD50521.1 long-chain fatty acid--CoA ligase [Candidatus Contendobacter sp.]